MNRFEDQDLYRAARRLHRFVHGIEERFPDEDRASLHGPMRSLSLEIGARIASGFSCLGEGAGGGFPGENHRDIRIKLAELRHYILTAGERHHVDSEGLREFDRIHDDLIRLLNAIMESGRGA